NGERKVSVHSPFEHCLCLITHVSRVARLSGLNEVHCWTVEAITRARSPEAVPIDGQDKVWAQRQVQLWVNVNVVCWANQRRLTEICAAREQRIEGLEVGVVRIVVAARNVRL